VLLGCYSVSVHSLLSDASHLTRSSIRRLRIRALHTTIHRYWVKLESATDVVHLAERELLPALGSIPGFVSAQILSAGGHVVVSICTFESLDAAHAAAIVNRRWVDTIAAGLVDTCVAVTTGQVRVTVAGAPVQRPEALRGASERDRLAWA
jgi:hypothetical protein